MPEKTWGTALEETRGDLSDRGRLGRSERVDGPFMTPCGWAVHDALRMARLMY